MRKMTAFLLVLSVLFSFAACGKKNKIDFPDEPLVPSSPLLQGIVAAQIGERELSNVEFTYFYVDAIHQYCDQYADYLSSFVDVSKPLNEQIYNQDTGKTWTDAFMEMALDQAKWIYALYDAAVAADHSLSAHEQQELDSLIDGMEAVAKEKGFQRVGDYLQAYYGFGASMRTYREYCECVAMAKSYNSAYQRNLLNSYTSENLRAFEENCSYLYDAYSYLAYTVRAEDFDDPDAAADAAKALAVPANNTESKLNRAIKKIVGSSEVCRKNEDVSYRQLDTVARDWLADPQRKDGDVAYFPEYRLPTEGENDCEILLGYLVVVYLEAKDNQYPLVNVRHILVTGEDAAPMETARQLLKQWREGEKTEESFGVLADMYSKDHAVGGLYVDIVPGQMAEAFNHWCFDRKRVVGDTGIVETQYGVHVMYFSGYSALTYRDYMVRRDLHEKDLEAWNIQLRNALTGTLRDSSKLAKNLVIEDMLR